RGLGVPDDIGHRGVAIPALGNGCGQAVEKTIAKRTVGRRRPVRVVFHDSDRNHRSFLHRPCDVLVLPGTVLYGTDGTSWYHRAGQEVIPMSEATIDRTVDTMPAAVRVPPSPPLPKAMQAVGYA